MKQPMREYYVIYEQDEDNGYIASAPAISGCVVHGKTLRDAHKNIYAAIAECLEVIHDFRKTPPPEPIKPAMVEKISFVRVPDYA
jgi:predicted RNase H-like HicB family nuclease